MKAPGLDLVGRSSELAKVEEAVRRARAGQSVSAVISGEPGIGKTQVLRVLCARSASHGLLVLTGRATEFESQMPFAMMGDALAPLLDEGDPQWLAELRPEDPAELARVSPSPDGRNGSLQTLAVEPHRTHGAMRSVLAEAAAQRPVLLALDDVQWADNGSAELIGQLVRRPLPGLLLAFATRWRRTPPVLLRSLFRGERDGTVVRIELRPLSESDARAMVGDRVDDTALRGMHRASGGNPFYLRELVRAADARRAEGSGRDRFLDEAEGMDRPVPSTVLDVVREELSAVTWAGRRLLEAAAVAGEPFELELVAAVAELAEPEAVESLDELADQDLLRATDTPGQYIFRHPIIGHAIYESTSASARLAAHTRAAGWLQNRSAGPAEVAPHVERSARRGDAQAVALLATAAAECAARATATAARWYSSALRLLEPGANPGRRLELLIPLAAALESLGRVEESRSALTDALPHVSKQPELRGQLVCAIARLDYMAGANGGAERMLLDALQDLDGPSVTSCSIKLELAREHWAPTGVTLMAGYSEAARDEARILGDTTLYATACALLAQSRVLLGQIEAASVSADEAAQLVDKMPDGEAAVRLETIADLGMAEYGLERFIRSERHLERAVSLSRSTGQQASVARLLVLLAIARLWQGRLRDANTAAENAVESSVPGHDRVRVAALGVRCWLAALSGDADDGVRYGEEAIAIGDRLPSGVVSWFHGCCWGVALIEAGRPDAGREAILASAGGAGLSSVDSVFRVHLFARLSSAELRLERTDAAERWAQLARDTASQLRLPGQVADAECATARVELARGNAEVAARLADGAASELLRVGRQLDAAHATIVVAEALLQLGHRSLAIAKLESARSAFAECGAERYEHAIVEQLCSVGRGVRGRGKGQGVGPSGTPALTKRELEVAMLVGTGLTNRQIAAQLFVGQKTVETHLSRVFKKLHVHSRAALAAKLARQQADQSGPD